LTPYQFDAAGVNGSVTAQLGLRPVPLVSPCTNWRTSMLWRSQRSNSCRDRAKAQPLERRIDTCLNGDPT